MKTLFISGKTAGIEDLNEPKFEEFRQKFEGLGYKVITPHSIRKNWDSTLSENDLTKVEIAKILEEVDIIAVMDNWINSKESMLQVFVAQQLGIKIIEVETENELPYELEIKARVRKKENETPEVP